ERTLKRRVVCWLESTSSLAILTLPPCWPASCSRIGAITWHGPHHVAQKSTSTRPWDCSTSAAKVASVTWAIWVLVALILLFSVSLRHGAAAFDMCSAGLSGRCLSGATRD